MIRLFACLFGKYVLVVCLLICCRLVCLVVYVFYIGVGNLGMPVGRTQLRGEAHQDRRKKLTLVDHVNMYPWKHVPLDLEDWEIMSICHGLDQASEKFTQNYSQKAPKGVSDPRVHVRIFELGDWKVVFCTGVPQDFGPRLCCFE